MKAFKVVRKRNDNYISAIIDLNGVTVEYIVGQWVGPRIDNSKIFIFDTLFGAKDWARNVVDTPYEVWECEVDCIDKETKKNVIPGLAVTSIRDVLQCWNTIEGWIKYGQVTNEIEDSGLCNYIKLVKQVYVS
jgi:hypothetical protein